MVVNGNKRNTLRSVQETLPTPYWLKVLEQRYDRLHANVINGTIRFTANRNISILSKRSTCHYLKVYKNTNRRNIVTPVQIGSSCDFNDNFRSDKVYKQDCNEIDHSDSSYLHRSTVESVKRDFSSRDFEDISSLKHHGSRQDICAVVRNNDSVSTCTTSRISGVNSLNVINSNLSSEKGANSRLYSQNSICAHKKTASVKLPYLVHVRERKLYARDDEEMESTRLKNNTNRSMNITADIITEDGDVNNDCDDGGKYSEENKQIENRAVKQWDKLQRRTKSGIVRSNNKISASVSLQVLDGGSMETTNKGNILAVTGILDHMTDAKLPLTARPDSRTRVFAGMSVEARRAVHETLKEMKGSDMLEQDNTSSGNSIPERSHYEQVNLDSTDSVTNIKNVHSLSYSSNQSRDEDSITSDRNRSISAQLSNNSSSVHQLLKSSYKNRASENKQSVVDPSSETFNFMKARQETTRRLSHPDSNVAHLSWILPNPRVQLPGIDTFKASSSFRESTFEITPLNFDIRFQHIISRQKPKRDALSADILRRSIDKCNQWLIRYTPRN